MILPEHLEILEHEGKRIFTLNGDTYFIGIRDKRTGRVRKIFLPDIPFGTPHKEVAAAFNKTIGEVIDDDIQQSGPKSNG